MPTVLSFPFACSALTPRNRVKKKKGREKRRKKWHAKRERNGDTRLHIRFRLKVTRFQRKIELSSPFDTHARSKIVHISCQRKSNSFLLHSFLSLTFFLSVCFERGENSRFHAFIIPENSRRVRTVLEHSPRILVHQDAAIVYKCKKGWLRFRWRLEDGKADKTRDWWFTIAAPRRASPCPTCRIGKCGARACLVIEEFVFSFAEFTLLRKSHDFRVSVRVELPSSPLSPPSSLPSWITQHHRFDSSLISRILVENFCWDTVGISEFLYFFSRLDRGNVTFFFFF